jgi:hypothetical protein
MWANKGFLLSHKNTLIVNFQMAQIENSGHKVEGPFMVTVCMNIYAVLATV